MQESRKAHDVTEPLDIGSDRFVCDLAADTPPAVEVTPGATLRIRCRGALDYAVGPGPVRAPGPNPGTGPIAVAGARPGQALVFDILEVAPESPGHVSAGPGGGEEAVEIVGGRVRYRGIAVPLRPMIGVLGLAPESGAWNTMDAGPFGGNMDTSDLAAGASVHIPVRQPSGRFIVGDVHAVMGDGEIGGQGLECAATVTLRVGVRAEPVSDHVTIFRDDQVMIVGTGETLEAAVADAAGAMAALVARVTGLDDFAATKLLGLAGQTRFGQHCCRIKTVRVAMPLELVPGLRAGRDSAEESDATST